MNWLSILCVSLLIGLVGCSSKHLPLEPTVKYGANDPFAETFPQSQYFDVIAEENQVIEGRNGTVVAFPSGCFLNERGEKVVGAVQIELVEALSLEKMLLANLTTSADGKMLETDGMLFLNATANGEQLRIDANNPVYVEIPTVKRKSDMMAYKGLRDSLGNMNWVDPKPLENFLTTVDLSELDFLPNDFAAHVEFGMPMFGRETADKEFIDSLYYSLSVSDGTELLKDIVQTAYNEPYYTKNDNTDVQTHSMGTEEDSASGECGIDPARIKVLKSVDFQNSLIATREFEKRLQTVFRSCKNEVLEVYVNNLGKNLWELDSMAAKLVGENNGHQADHVYDEFMEYSAQRLTNVRDADKYGAALSKFYATRLTLVKEELLAAKEKLVKQLAEEGKMATETANEYKELLQKRENYRMETYGFEWSETGWINIDRGTIEKDWGSQRFELLAKNGAAYDKVFAYVIYTSIKSLYRLNSDDQETFYVGNTNERQMLMPKRSEAVAIAIAYRNDSVFFALNDFQTGADRTLQLLLKPSSQEEIEKATVVYDAYSPENRIHEDIDYMVLLWKEEQKQQKRWSEIEYLRDLWISVFNCCEYPILMGGA